MMAKNGSTIALEADPADPDDFDATEAEVEAALAERRTRTRGPQRAPIKQPVTIRLDADLAEHFRASGHGWQTRLNDLLRRAAGLNAPTA